VRQSTAHRLTNRMKERAGAGDVELGITVPVISRTHDIERIAKRMPRFIFIDSSTRSSASRRSRASRIPRWRSASRRWCGWRGIDDPDVSLLLDNGVTGII